MYDGVSANIDSNVTTVADDVAWLCICKAYAITMGVGLVMIGYHHFVGGAILP